MKMNGAINSFYRTSQLKAALYNNVYTQSSKDPYARAAVYTKLVLTELDDEDTQDGRSPPLPHHIELLPTPSTLIVMN